MKFLFATVLLFTFNVFAQNNLTTDLTKIESTARELLQRGSLMTTDDVRAYANLSANTADFIFNTLAKSQASETEKTEMAKRAAQAVGNLLVASSDHYIDSAPLPRPGLYQYDKAAFFIEWTKYPFVVLWNSTRNLLAEGNPFWGRDARRTRAITGMIKQLDKTSDKVETESLSNVPKERLEFLTTFYNQLRNIEPIENHTINRAGTIAMWAGIGFLAFYPVEITFQLVADSPIFSSAIWLGLGAVMHQARTLGRGTSIGEFVMKRTKVLETMGLKGVCSDFLTDPKLELRQQLGRF